MKKRDVATEKIMENVEDILSSLYKMNRDGIEGKCLPLEEMIKEYMDQASNNTELAIEDLIKNQLKKVKSSAKFLLGAGFLPELEEIVSEQSRNILFIQYRMISAIALMAGYQIENDQVQTCIYSALAGISLNATFKRFGVKVQKAMKIDKEIIAALPKVVDFVQKYAGKKILKGLTANKVRAALFILPHAANAAASYLDYRSTKRIAKEAYDLFIKGKDLKNRKIKPLQLSLN